MQAPVDSPGRGRARDVALVVLLPLVLTAALGTWGIGRPSMYGSEADTYWAAQLTLPHLGHLLAHVDAVHGLYYAAVHVWLDLDRSVVWMRVLSVLGACAACAGTALLGRRLAGPRVAIIAGVLYALTPYVEEYAQNGRSYAWVAAVVTAELLALLRALDAPERRGRWLAYAGLVVVAGYLHEMTLLVQAGLAVTFVLARTPRPVLRRWLLWTAAASALVSPLVLLSYRESAAVRYLRPAGWPQVRALGQIYFGLDVRVEYAGLALAALAVLPFRARSNGNRDGLTVARLAAPLVVVPAATLMLASHAAHSLYDSRYVLYGAVGAALLVAAGLDRVARAAVRLRAGAGQRVLVAAVTLAAVLAGTAVQWPVQQRIRTVASRGQDFGTAARYLALAASPGDAYVFVPLSTRSMELGYPQDFRRLSDVTLHRSPVQTGTFLGTYRNAAAIRGSMLRRGRVWVVGRLTRRHDVLGIGRVLRAYFRFVSARRFTGVSVALYVRRAGVAISPRPPRCRGAPAAGPVRARRPRRPGRRSRTATGSAASRPAVPASCRWT